MPKPKRKKTISVPLLAVPVQNDGLHLILRVVINGKAARMVLDTGASRTVLDKSRMKRFLKGNSMQKHDAVSTGLGTSSMESFVAALKRFEIGELKLIDYTAVLLDLAHVNKTLKRAGMKEIDGVLGGDVLALHKAVIDYKRKKLKLEG